MPLPNITDIDQMKDSDLLYAADLKGRAVTVEITDINARDFQDEDEKGKRMYLLELKGTPKKLGINATNRTLISKMFGRNPNGWTGKRITLKPATTRMAGETVPCIRVCGSPDISGTINVKTQLGRSTLKAVLTKTETKTNGAAAETKPPVQETKPQSAETSRPEPETAVLDAWTALGWSQEQGLKHMEIFTASTPSANYLDHLGVMIDQENEKEESL